MLKIIEGCNPFQPGGPGRASNQKYYIKKGSVSSFLRLTQTTFFYIQNGSFHIKKNIRARLQEKL